MCIANQEIKLFQQGRVSRKPLEAYGLKAAMKIINIPKKYVNIIQEKMPDLDIRYNGKKDKHYVKKEPGLYEDIDKIIKDHDGAVTLEDSVDEEKSSEDIPEKKHDPNKTKYNLTIEEANILKKHYSDGDKTMDLDIGYKNTKRDFLTACLGKIATGAFTIIAFSDAIKTTIDQIFIGNWTEKTRYDFLNHIGWDVYGGSFLFAGYLAASSASDYFKNKLLAYEIVSLEQQLANKQ